ncbi:MFS transporter [Castellaniella sp. S9]|uniref:MFS transporter n=1 Tax=Castellaniella sp. S9 TaxID=2993652 RepID=UPI0022B4F072|nr:MFS transporter [Castellaniella sp. S9]
MKSDPSSASWLDLLWGRNGLRSLALAGGVAVHAINVFIATTILPSVVQDIGGLAYYAWNTTLFVAASILGSSGAPLGIHRYGLRRIFLYALCMFVLGTIACALAPSMPWLLFGRTWQGLGGGMLLSLSYATVPLVFHEGLWSRAMALISGMWGVATLAGPAIGGIFAQAGLWRWAFWAVLPVCAVLGLLLVTQLGPVGRNPGTRHGAPLGRMGLLVGSVLTVSAASLAAGWGWQLAGVAGGLALVALLAGVDRRAAQRFLPEGAWSLSSPLGRRYAMIGLMSIGVTTEVFVPYFLQVIHGASPLAAGYLSALMSAGWTLGTLFSSSRGPVAIGRLLVVGPLLSAIALGALCLLMPAQDAGLRVLSVLLLGVGLGVGLCWPHLLTGVFRAAPEGQRNIASAAITTLQLYAMALGASVAGMAANAAGFTDPGGLEGARRAAWGVYGVFVCAPALAAWLGNRARRDDRPPGSPAAVSPS